MQFFTHLRLFLCVRCDLNPKIFLQYSSHFHGFETGSDRSKHLHFLYSKIVDERGGFNIKEAVTEVLLLSLPRRELPECSAVVMIIQKKRHVAVVVFQLVVRTVQVCIAVVNIEIEEQRRHSSPFPHFDHLLSVVADDAVDVMPGYPVVSLTPEDAKTFVKAISCESQEDGDTSLSSDVVRKTSFPVSVSLTGMSWFGFWLCLSSCSSIEF
jgi:hypothetical protein